MIAYVLCVGSVLHDVSDLIYYVGLRPLSLEFECEFGICLSIGDTVDIMGQSYTTLTHLGEKVPPRAFATSCFAFVFALCYVHATCLLHGSREYAKEFCRS